MKIRKALTYIIIIIICALLVYFFIDLSNNDVSNNTISRGQFAKAISLALFSQEECEIYEKNYFNEEDSKVWAVHYMNKLYSCEYIDSNDFEPTKNSINKDLIYKDLKLLINKLDIDKVKLLKILEDYKDNEKVKLNDFIKIYDSLLEQVDTQEMVNKKTISILQKEVDSYYTTEGELKANGLSIEDYIDKQVEVYLKGNEIILLSAILSDEVVYSNSYVVKVEGGILYAFIEGVTREFKIKDVDDTINGTIVDIYIKNKRVCKLCLKQDRINGKVLEIDESGVEIETYAKLGFTEDFKVYRTYGNIQMQEVNKILVGYDTTTFFVADGKICAAIITKDIEAKNIRVLIKDNNFANLFHNSVSITCDGSYTISYGELKETFEAGHQIDININSSYLTAGRIKIEPVDTNTKLAISSITREYGTPSYRGSIEVAVNNGSLLIINELPLEEYLYSVIPSEMPTSYGMEALYVQAVCARSYAYRQLLNNAYSQYGAHVDDSISFQVYNNILESEMSINAVNETYGKILTYNGEVIEAFFFSTSAGSTTDATVWGNDDLPYIKGRLLCKDDTQLDLSNSQVFDSFIRQNYDTYDSAFPWYRWNCTISIDKLTNSINNNIAKRYQLNKNNILTKSNDGSFISCDISSIGDLHKIEIAKRGSGGVISELILYGSLKTVLVKTESNIRNLISVDGVDINKNDGNVVNTNKTLPSAYFVLDEVVENNGLTGYKFTGGGLGHGVGMSQNAVKAMTEAGMGWKDILLYFYNCVDLSDI